MNDPVAAISSGFDYSLALLNSGSLLALGNNTYGQLGIGTINDHYHESPQAVNLGSPVQTIGTGFNHSLALLESGRVMAWGRNEYGQLASSQVGSKAPREIATLRGKVQLIAVGGDHNLALLKDGTVCAWGSNRRGQLTQENSAFISPQEIGFLKGKVRSLAAGGVHSLALLKDGSIYAWGDNSFGQLGIGGSSYPAIELVKVPGLPAKAISITAGENHNLALLENGAVYSWGYNYQGQCGLGLNQGKFIYPPREIKSLRNRVQSLRAGIDHSLALLKNGKTIFWGANQSLDPLQLPTGQLSPRLVRSSVRNLATPLFSEKAAGFAPHIRNLELLIRAQLQQELEI